MLVYLDIGPLSKSLMLKEVVLVDPNQYDWCPTEKGDTRDALTHIQKEHKKAAICKPMRETSGEITPVYTLIWDFQSPDL